MRKASSFGCKLRSLLAVHGLTQAAAARALGVSEPVLSRIASGIRRALNTKERRQLAEFLGVRPAGNFSPEEAAQKKLKQKARSHAVNRYRERKSVLPNKEYPFPSGSSNPQNVQLAGAIAPLTHQTCTPGLIHFETFCGECDRLNGGDRQVIFCAALALDQEPAVGDALSESTELLEHLWIRRKHELPIFEQR